MNNNLNLVYNWAKSIYENALNASDALLDNDPDEDDIATAIHNLGSIMGACEIIMTTTKTSN